MEPARNGGKHRGNISRFDVDAAIVKRMRCEMSKRAAVPFHYRRNELNDADGGIRRKKIENSTQSEAHSQAADEHGGLFELPQVMPRRFRQELFRRVGAAGHEDRAASEDQVFIAPTNQLQQGAVGRKLLVERFERFHASDVTGAEN